MGPVSRWAVNRPWQAIITWAVLLVVILGLTATNMGKLNDSFSLPNTDSTRAANLLASEFGSETSNASVQILFRNTSGTIADKQTEADIKALTKQVEALPSVASVQSPYNEPSAIAALKSGLVSPTGQIGKLNVTFKMPDVDVPKADGQAIVEKVESLNSSSMTVGAAGTVIGTATSHTPESEVVGIIAAIIIMLIMFGSVVAAGLPLLTAMLGLLVGLCLLLISANIMTMASFAPTLAAMIGLGVGFDYSLFLLNRYRQAVLAGEEPKQAAHTAVGTAGRAIVFAALTVVIALSGLFVLGLSFLNGLAVGAAVTVVAVMITAVTLLPAILSLLGPRVFALKMPWGRKPATADRGRRFRNYAVLVERRRWLFGGGALLLMAVLAVPALSMREGFPDASGNPPTDPQRIAYNLTAQAFGPGANGPFIVVAQLPDAAALPQAQALSKAIGDAPDVALATPVDPGSKAISKNGKTVLITVIPKTGPQSAGTQDLLVQLRNTTIPQAVKGTGLIAYVGGSTAVAEDFSSVLSEKLPEFLLVVVGLGFLVLMVLFRSLLIPLTAAVTALLSYGAALGVSVFVFQWGNLISLFGVSSAGPILPFLPVMLFAILFGLSMDYQVFLVSRMQEEWENHHDNRLAVRVGLGGSGLVVVAAAAIMFCVFLSFVFQDNATIKLFGLSLAVAIALDAFVIRLMFVPALMTLLGKANWYLPKWLGKILPKVTVEGPSASAQHSAPEEDQDKEKEPATTGS
ncbi:MAG: MMPL family transporter [Candidatus Nanopelagicales bacterium]